jgi:GNAT superfamily N-acetyltransferase
MREPTMHQQWNEKLLDGTPVLIRPIGPQDAERERIYIENLSLESRYFRFLEGMRTPSPELIKKLTEVDHDRDAAFVALIGEGAQQRQIGVARYSLDADGESCECAVSVSDDFQHRGLGTLLMRHLIEKARARGIKHMYSIDAAENRSMWGFAEHLGFERHRDPDDARLTRHTIHLGVHRGGCPVAAGA